MHFFLQLVLQFCCAVAKRLKFYETLPSVAFPKVNNLAKLELDSTLWNGCCYKSVITHVHFGGLYAKEFLGKKLRDKLWVELGSVRTHLISLFLSKRKGKTSNHFQKYCLPLLEKLLAGLFWRQQMRIDYHYNMHESLLSPVAQRLPAK